MAGTLTISTLSDGTNSTSSTNCIQGSAKAWVKYNSIAQTISGSYNVSSVTYNSTGIFTINFTNALSNANYVITGNCNSPSTANGIFQGTNSSGAPPTTTAAQVLTVNTAQAVANYNNVNVVIIGN